MRNMVVPRVVPTVLGVTAALATMAILVIHCILARELLGSNTSVRTAAILSSVLEALVLVLLGALMASDLRPRTSRSPRMAFNNTWLGASLLLCTVAAAASVAAVVCLRNSPPTTLPSHVLGSTINGFLAGCSVALGLSFALQLIFLVVHYIASRIEKQDRTHSPETGAASRRSPLPQVKSIPYHQTTPGATTSFLHEKREATSMDSRSPPGSSGGRSATETMSSIRSSMSHFVRPTTSKTRLLSSSQRSSRHRPASLDSNAFQERSSVVNEDGFDSWDTSAVDPQNRQTVLESSSPIPGRFLETIPASPSTSRSPSPGTPLDLDPPRRARRRSRSYSPAPSAHSVLIQAPSLTEHQSVSESHIHPLFRSDSPTPAPAATPGTVVTAAPNAGQIISAPPSIRTLNRMRSGSLPTAGPSPLSRQGSFDDFHLRRDRVPSVSPSVSPELREEPEEEEEAKGAERKMTPPIPDWILSAGSRMSMAGYASRKVRSADGEER